MPDARVGAAADNRRMTLALAALAAVTLAQPLRAFALAADPAPPEGAAVAVTSAQIHIALHDAFAIVDAELVLGGPGARPATALRFPGAGVLPFAGARPCTQCTHRPLVGFEARVNGAAAAPVAGEGREAWHVVRVPEGQGPAKVRVRYGLLTSLPSASAVGISPELQADGPDVTLWYLRSTGAAWAGATGKTTITLVARGGVKPASIQVRDQRMAPFVLMAEPTGPRDPGWRHAPPTLPSFGKRTAEGVVLTLDPAEPAPADDLEILYAPDWLKRFAGMSAQYGGDAYKAKVTAELTAVLAGKPVGLKGTVGGRVFDRQGAGLGGVDVVALGPDGTEQARTRSSPTGVWTLAELDPGTWVFQAPGRPGAFDPPGRELEVIGGARATIDFRERTGPSLTLQSRNKKLYDGLALLLPQGTAAPTRIADLARLERIGFVGVPFGEGSAFREIPPGTWLLVTVDAEAGGTRAMRKRLITVAAGPNAALPYFESPPVPLR